MLSGISSKIGKASHVTQRLEYGEKSGRGFERKEIKLEEIARSSVSYQIHRLSSCSLRHSSIHVNTRAALARAEKRSSSALRFAFILFHEIAFVVGTSEINHHRAKPGNVVTRLSFLLRQMRCNIINFLHIAMHTIKFSRNIKFYTAKRE